MKYWVSIDPGLGGTGVALWEGRQYVWSTSVSLQEEDWCTKAAMTARAVAYAIKNKHAEPYKMYFELPALMGMATARRGDLVKLTIAAGAIVGCFASFFPACVVVPVPVVEWKGQLLKELCNERVRKYMGWPKDRITSTHELDAIGIGLHATGRFR